MKNYSKYYVPFLLLVYVLKVYGSLLLYEYNLINDDVWCYIHYVGTCILLCLFLYLLKDKVSKLIYSLGMSIFVSRLITQLFHKGEEYWYEMLFVIIITFLIYLMSNNLNKINKWKFKS